MPNSPPLRRRLGDHRPNVLVCQNPGSLGIAAKLHDVLISIVGGQNQFGAPDYILTKKDIPVGYIEAKDIGDKDLDGIKKTVNKVQFDRYKASLNNLFFTDYLDFHLYRDGQFITKIAVAELTDKGIKPLPENFSAFEDLIKNGK